ncbi:UvrD-helicase domain-containing protein [Dokdonella sp.]|uniref:UvrD-helicase domain-containing protein n=1 Tax=Dokdonella sp. TaxID=2291710 RepID=UPI002F42C287
MNPSPRTTLQPLDWRTMALDRRVLIEASAGTGKTWSIGLVYLRLLLECDIGVEQILVTTFTVAAAQELRERLRQRIVEAEQWLQRHVEGAHGASSSDASPLDGYLAERCREPGWAERSLRRMRIARADIDRAPISTIHALCQRIQRDFPLESGAAFGEERLVADEDLRRECVEDFWRLRYLDGAVDAEERRVVFREGPEGLLRDLGTIAASGDDWIEPDGYDAIVERAARLANPSDIAELRRLANDAGLYDGRKRALAKRLDQVAAILEHSPPSIDDLALALDDYFSDAMIEQQQATSASVRLREHPLVRELQRLRESIAARAVLVRGRVLAAAAQACRSGIPERAQRRGVATFAMLIDRIHARLADPEHGPVLADRLFTAFPAALIDEFQDTDTRQYAIFDRIYRDVRGGERGSLVMIGDPKQAIYAFRGGDIGAYMAASRQAGARHSLATNQRSARRLVDALNALYGDAGGFGTSGIDYQPVSAAGRADAKPYRVDGVPLERPLLLHLFAEDRAGKQPVSRLHELALDDCANDIVARLGDGSHTIDGRPLAPGDFAVLVPTNIDVIAMRRRLRQRGVPCAGGGRGSVFESEAAAELELLLHAVLNAEDERAVRAALATRLLGADLAVLEQWTQSPAAFEREIERFAQWRELARQRGVLALLRAVLERRAGALLAGTDGERMLTDLRHLGELLAAEEARRHGLEGLLAWFATIRREKGDDDTAANDARQLRIESDAARVQIMTIHSSKGLEFPIVYLPLAWRVQDLHGVRAPRVLRFRDEAGHLRIDVGSRDFLANRARHHRDALDERLRLLYVGLTRAVHALHVYWTDRGSVPGDGGIDAATAWHVAALDVLVEAALRRGGAARGEAGLREFARAVPGIDVVGAHAGTPAPFEADGNLQLPRAVQAPAPGLRRFEWQHSFSSLVRGIAAHVAEEAGASDEALAEAEVEIESSPAEDPRLAVLQAWRGPRFGDAVHALFEHAGAQALWPAQRERIEHELLARGLRAAAGDAGAVEHVGRMVDRCRMADLGGGLKLAAVGDDQRICEFEFQLPVDDVSVAHLRQLCERHGVTDVVPAALDRHVMNGMLGGFVDLVFAWDGRYHVLDYKTNWLGASLVDYGADALDAAMQAHHYPLQALLYSVALHRYLGRRMRGYAAERDLGASWYLFVRAVGFGTGLGVWHRRWPVALIEAIDAELAGGAKEAA